MDVPVLNIGDTLIVSYMKLRIRESYQAEHLKLSLYLDQKCSGVSLLDYQPRAQEFRSPQAERF